MLTRRARSAWRRESRIAFVCLGNIGRSPFAERLAERHAWGEKEFVSAGFVPTVGRGAPDEALDAAQRRGIDLSGHRSRTVDEGLVRDARTIYVFDESNWRKMVQRRVRQARGVRRSLEYGLRST